MLQPDNQRLRRHRRWHVGKIAGQSLHFPTMLVGPQQVHANAVVHRRNSASIEGVQEPNEVLQESNDLKHRRQLGTKYLPTRPWSKWHRQIVVRVLCLFPEVVTIQIQTQSQRSLPCCHCRLISLEQCVLSRPNGTTKAAWPSNDPKRPTCSCQAATKTAGGNTAHKQATH